MRVRRMICETRRFTCKGGRVMLKEADATGTPVIVQLPCPFLHGWTTSAETQEGAAVRLLEHIVVGHVDQPPGTVPDEAMDPMTALFEDLKTKYK